MDGTDRPPPGDEDPAPDVPSGLPEEASDQPLGVPEADPEGEGEPARGHEAMPGIPTEGEPPSAG
jgi:hypothetical protein